MSSRQEDSMSAVTMLRDLIVDERARAALERMKAKVARRPGRWRRRMAGGLRLQPEARRDLPIAA
jgi:hypothetical protein